MQEISQPVMYLCLLCRDKRKKKGGAGGKDAVSYFRALRKYWKMYSDFNFVYSKIGTLVLSQVNKDFKLKIWGIILLPQNTG